MTLNWEVVAAIATVAGVILGPISSWVTSIKKTQITLFNKHDALNKDLQDYKLEVAKTYVNREALKEALQPIQEALKEIRQDLHQDRRDHP